MKSLGKEEKPIVGKLLNEVRAAVTAAIAESVEKFRMAKGGVRWPASIFRCLARRTKTARSIRSRKCSIAR